MEIGGGNMLVSLDNLERDVASNGDLGRITRFVNAIVAASDVDETPYSADRLYWSLEPNDYEEVADYRAAVSDQVDRVLVYLSDDDRLITWATPAMLDSLGLSEAEAGAAAFENLARALREASLEVDDIDGVALGFIGTTLPFKASLILAPNLREVVGPTLGWPLLAVVPDRDFLYLWGAQHRGFLGRVGGVVVKEYAKAAYPISTEVYEQSDDGIQAIGAFPKKT